jgi:Zn ribbon nucleic-acid-binding protein
MRSGRGEVKLMEKRSCQNCKKDFTIETEDFNFYEMMKVPAPTWCPECRITRRLAFGNAWGVHFRNCDRCGEKSLTMFHPKNPLKVFCDACWWKDDWDGTEYGVDYDPNRNFFEQWKELRDKTPHFAKDAVYPSLKNCEYTNAIAFSKNCYMSFWVDYCENVFYSSLLNTVKDSVDVFRVFKSEQCYESVGLGRCNRTHFSNTCDDCVDVWFSRNCYGCMNCFGCVNLRNKNYMIFNEQYSRERYFQELDKFKLDSRSSLMEVQEKADKFWLSLPYREYTGNPQNLNVSGDYIFNSKNVKNCFACVDTVDSRYCQFISVPKAESCMDYYGWGNMVSLLYEVATSGEELRNVKFSFGVFNSGLDLEYCGWCVGCKNCFGCSNLKRKQYCILNKQYSKEECFKLKKKIIEDMNKNLYADSKERIYKYGEFFPPEFSPFPYNDSNANKFIEKNRKQALKEGYYWRDKIENHYKKTIEIKDIPETIGETRESILNETIECISCGWGYRITLGEFNLYKKLNMPIPIKCFRCREARRFALMNKPKSYKMNCAKCGKEIITMHDPKWKRIIYCVECYQQEVY